MLKVVFSLLQMTMFTIPAGPTAITVTPVDATCGNNDGSVTLGAVTGGVAPYTIHLMVQRSLQRLFTWSGFRSIIRSL